MNLLFDFITLRLRTGAGEYVRRVFFETLSLIEREQLDIKVFALHDTSKPIAYEDMSETALVSRDITFLDAHSAPVDKLISENGIDRFFIGCAQYLGAYPEVANIKCEVICVTHDLAYEEIYQNRIGLYLRMCGKEAEEPIEKNWKIRLKTMLFPHAYFDNFTWSIIHSGGMRAQRTNTHLMENIMKLFHTNPHFTFVTVSEYSKGAAMYHFGIPAHKIKVLYSPERIMKANNCIENEKLRFLIAEKKRYYLMVSAGNMHKNASKAIRAFEAFQCLHPDCCLVTVGYKKSHYPAHVVLPYLSDGDLAQAYANCYALLYPSMFEGFGYPPIEAMHCGKPVLCSNATSMPEIFGDAPIYFSPIYESAIFTALCSLTEENYEEYGQRSRKKYIEVKNKQEEDLKNLLRMILK